LEGLVIDGKWLGVDWSHLAQRDLLTWQVNIFVPKVRKIFNEVRKYYVSRRTVRHDVSRSFFFFFFLLIIILLHHHHHQRHHSFIRSSLNIAIQQRRYGVLCSRHAVSCLTDFNTLASSQHLVFRRQTCKLELQFSLLPLLTT
jgi:hypothetical protein